MNDERHNIQPANNASRDFESYLALSQRTGHAFATVVATATRLGVEPAMRLNGVEYLDAGGVAAVLAQLQATTPGQRRTFERRPGRPV